MMSVNALRRSSRAIPTVDYAMSNRGEAPLPQRGRPNGGRPAASTAASTSAAASSAAEQRAPAKGGGQRAPQKRSIHSSDEDDDDASDTPSDEDSEHCPSPGKKPKQKQQKATSKRIAKKKDPPPPADQDLLGIGVVVQSAISGVKFKSPIMAMPVSLRRSEDFCWVAEQGQLRGHLDQIRGAASAFDRGAHAASSSLATDVLSALFPVTGPDVDGSCNVVALKLAALRFAGDTLTAAGQLLEADVCADGVVARLSESNHLLATDEALAELLIAREQSCKGLVLMLTVVSWGNADCESARNAAREAANMDDEKTRRAELLVEQRQAREDDTQRRTEEKQTAARQKNIDKVEKRQEKLRKQRQKEQEKEQADANRIVQISVHVGVGEWPFSCNVGAQFVYLT